MNIVIASSGSLARIGTSPVRAIGRRFWRKMRQESRIATLEKIVSQRDTKIQNLSQREKSSLARELKYARIAYDSMSWEYAEIRARHNDYVTRVGRGDTSDDAIDALVWTCTRLISLEESGESTWKRIQALKRQLNQK
jgi:hypothetical protein